MYLFEEFFEKFYLKVGSKMFRKDVLLLNMEKDTFIIEIINPILVLFHLKDFIKFCRRKKGNEKINITIKYKFLKLYI